MSRGFFIALHESVLGKICFTNHSKVCVLHIINEYNFNSFHRTPDS